MRPIYWLLLAEAAFFIIGAINIYQGLAFLFIPEYVVSYFIIFAMFVSWMLNNWVTYIFLINKVTADDLLGNK